LTRRIAPLLKFRAQAFPKELTSPHLWKHSSCYER